MTRSRISSFLLIVATLASLFTGSMSPAQARQPESVVTVSAQTQRAQVRPGDQFAVAVVLDIHGEWHIWPNTPEAVPGVDVLQTPTEVKLAAGQTAPSSLQVYWGDTLWPKSHAVRTAALGTDPIDIQVYSGQAIAYIPVVVAQNATPGPVELPIMVSFQACDDKQCMFPEDVVVPVKLEIVAAGATLAESTNASLFKGFDATVFGRLGGTPTAARAAASKPIQFDIFGTRVFEIDPSGPVGLTLLLLVAALGGFVLNLTPCVLPVVPIKILSLSAAAGDPKRCFYLGFVMSVGVVAFWMLIGGGIAFLTNFKAINQLFQLPGFSLAVGAFILIMGVGMVGLFSVTLPQAVYSIKPKKESTIGSFFFGMMTAVLSTPCTAPFMGAASGWAATQVPAITLATFAAIGIGMALPYLILSASPKLVKKVPKSGPSSVLVKEVMGLLMLAVAAFFLGTGLDPLLREPTESPMRVHWWFVAGLVIVAMAWLVYRTFKISAKPAPRVIWTAFGVILSALGVMIASKFTEKPPIDWVAYTPASFQERVAKGEVIVLDFTAEWCINCKTLESAVLHTPEIVKLLASPGITPMKVDLTSSANTDGRAKLQSLEWVGIPLLAIFGPGIDEPIKYDSYTVQTVKDAVERAKGKRTAALDGR